MIKNTCHLNLVMADTEVIEQKYRIWARNFTEIQNLSHNIIKDPILEFIPLTTNTALSFLITERELFLTLYNQSENILHNTIPLESVLHIRASSLKNIRDDIIAIDQGREIRFPQRLWSIWGETLPKIRREEDIISRVPFNLELQRHIERPFYITFVHNFSDNQLKMNFNINKNTYSCSFNNEDIDYHFLKSDHNRAYRLARAMNEVYYGIDYSQISKQNIMNHDIVLVQ